MLGFFTAMFIATISTEELNSSLERKDDLLVISIRGEEQDKECRISGAISAAYDKLKDQAKTWDKSKKVVVYCNRGNSSKVTTKNLKDMGFNAFSLDGGIAEWKRKGFKCEGTNCT